jgi:hypothetical protein
MRDRDGRPIAFGDRVTISGVYRGLRGSGQILVRPDGAGEDEMVAVRPSLASKEAEAPRSVYSDPDLDPWADPMLPAG